MFEELGEAVRHVHLSDARRPDVEGVMIGGIDMSFFPHLRGLPVLPEVWDGHLDGGQGSAKRSAGCAGNEVHPALHGRSFIPIT